MQGVGRKKPSFDIQRDEELAHPALFALFFRSHQFFEDDSRLGFVQVHLMHLPLVFCQMLLRAPQRFAVQCHMLLFSRFRAMKSFGRSISGGHVILSFSAVRIRG